jgi:hypothetical protein
MTVSSTLTWESRIPSETSLKFNSNPTSRNNSPSLVGQKLGQVGDAGIEPLLLDSTCGIQPDLCFGEGLDLPFQELADFDFDQDDLEGDGFLEMARVRK